jgi:hypothetical protein
VVAGHLGSGRIAAAGGEVGAGGMSLGIIAPVTVIPVISVIPISLHAKVNPNIC